MSSDAVGWVFRHSPYKGVTFAVHVAVADSVNDQNDNELWMSVGKLATKARCSRRSAGDALAQITSDGYLALLKQQTGRPSRYQFLFPDHAEVAFESRSKAPVEPAQPLRTPPADLRNEQHATCATSNTDLRSDCALTQENPSEPKQVNPSAPPAPKMPEDPLLAAEARACAQFAFEQDPKPVSPFLAVLARCTEAIRAGHTPDDLRRVIAEGDVTWTRPALEYRLGQAKAAPRQSGFTRSAILKRPDRLPLNEAVTGGPRPALDAIPVDALELGSGAR